jgi:hypothetical protein
MMPAPIITIFFGIDMAGMRKNMVWWIQETAETTQESWWGEVDDDVKLSRSRASRLPDFNRDDAISMTDHITVHILRKVAQDESENDKIYSDIEMITRARALVEDGIRSARWRCPRPLTAFKQPASFYCMLFDFNSGLLTRLCIVGGNTYIYSPLPPSRLAYLPSPHGSVAQQSISKIWGDHLLPSEMASLRDLGDFESTEFVVALSRPVLVDVEQHRRSGSPLLSPTSKRLKVEEGPLDEVIPHVSLPFRLLGLSFN